MHIKKITTYSIPALWILALVLPAYKLAGVSGIPAQSMFGWSCVFWGGIGSLMGTGTLVTFLAWLANVPFWIAYFQWKSAKPIQRSTVLLSALAFFLSCGASTVTQLPLDEAVHWSPAQITFGAYVWMSSLLLLFIMTTTLYVKQKRSS